MRLHFPAVIFALSLSVLGFSADAAVKKGSSSRTSSKAAAKSAKSTSSNKEKKTEQSSDAAKPTVTVEASEEIPPPPPVKPEEWLPKSKLYQAGVKALSGNMPDVAIKNFEDLLKSTPPQEVLPYINRQLGEAYVRNGQFEEGLAIFKNSRDIDDAPGALFWEGMANKGKGSYSVALRLFNSLENKKELDERLHTALLWQMAEIHGILGNYDQNKRVLTRLLEMPEQQTKFVASLALAALDLTNDRPGEARAIAQEIVDSPKKISPQMLGLAKLILCRALMKEGNPEEALTILTKIITENSLPPHIMSMIKLNAAEAEISLEKKGGVSEEETGKGEDRLLTFIETQADSPFLAEAFNILHNTKAFSDARAYEKLQEWARGEHPNRAPYALGMVTRLLMEKEDASQFPEIFIRAGEKFAEHKVTRDLQYLILQYMYDHKLIEDAEKLIKKLPESDAKTRFMEGGLQYAKENFWKAGEQYDQAFDGLPDARGNIEQLAAYNTYISALRAEMPQLVKKLESSTEVDQETQADILLEKALALASWGSEDASKELQRFLEIYPKHRRVADAWLALGEWALYQEKKDESLTLKTLNELEKLPLTDQEKERTARLKVLLSEQAGQWAVAREAAKEYLDVYKSPELRDPMQLKMGELLYRDNEFNQAHLYIQRVIQNLPSDSRYLPYALFLSGKAAQQTGTNQSMEEALKIFNKVAKIDSPYKSAAVIESASIMMRRGQSKEVIEMLEEFMSKQEMTPESRRMALALEAEAWAALATSDPKALDTARKLTEKILEEENLPLAWRNRTLFQQAKISEKVGDTTAALRDYHLILNMPLSEGEAPEWYWYYQGGFSAMRLLEDQKNWIAAISIAETMAKTKGPRAEDAANRAKKLRLEQFVWSEGEGPEAKDAAPSVVLVVPDTLTLPPSILGTERKGEQETPKKDAKEEQVTSEK